MLDTELILNEQLLAGTIFWRSQTEDESPRSQGCAMACCEYAPLPGNKWCEICKEIFGVRETK